MWTGFHLLRHCYCSKAGTRRGQKKKSCLVSWKSLRFAIGICGVVRRSRQTCHGRHLGRSWGTTATRLRNYAEEHIEGLAKEGNPLHVGRFTVTSHRRWVYGLLLLTAMLLVVASCNFPGSPLLFPPDLDQVAPDAGLLWRPKTALPDNWAVGKQLWQPPNRPALNVDLPLIADAVLAGLDAQCVLCHETYVTAFSNNIHKKQGCEECHGPASRHIESRGSGQASILSLKPMDGVTAAGRAITPAERSEICLRCHQTDPEPIGMTWRSSAHAHKEIACSDCHVAHYNIPPGTPATILGATDGASDGSHVAVARMLQLTSPGQPSSGNLAAKSPTTCYRCHDDMKRFEQPGHPHQIGTPIAVDDAKNAPGAAVHPGNFNCTTCHDPHGSILRATRKDLCLQCHDGPHMDQWHGSQHDLAGIGCTDCHDPHPADEAAMTVDMPNVCYRCHAGTQQLEEIAGPHQIQGANGLNCNTCHDPHGKVVAATRTDVCLDCHTGAPTMAWHSSFHSREGVACADCHNPHPDVSVPRVIGINHTSLNRSTRRPMEVDEPATCYKCHPKIFGMASMPSHHPIQEGRMVCSDCHDSHGQNHGSLKAETLNQLCFQCHAEKEGPFVWEHAPVTESCAICHQVHGTVANNLLLQPPMFLCLRCHTAHATHDGSPQCTRCHLVNGTPNLVGGGPRDPTIPTTPSSRKAMFTDCTQCHSQIHGSDNPSGFEHGDGFRR